MVKVCKTKAASLATPQCEQQFQSAKKQEFSETDLSDLRFHVSPATPRILPRLNDKIASRLFADMSLLQLKSLVYCDALATVRLHRQKSRFAVIGLSDRS